MSIRNGRPAAFLRQLALAAALAGAAAAAPAAIVYQIDRSIGAATLTGFIETDGTLGAISIGNFTSFSLTLTGPDINNGAPSTIVSGSEFFELAGPSQLSATASDLLFDFDGPASLLYAYTNTGDFWCLATGGDTGCFEQGEVVGYSDATLDEAYSVARTGVSVLGSVAVAAVPEPAGWALAAGALGLLALQRRRATARA